MAEANQYEIEARLRKRLARTTLVGEGSFGADTEMTLTEEGVNRLFDALKLEGLKIVEE